MKLLTRNQNEFELYNIRLNLWILLHVFTLSIWWMFFKNVWNLFNLRFFLKIPETDETSAPERAYWIEQNSWTSL